MVAPACRVYLFLVALSPLAAAQSAVFTGEACVGNSAASGGVCSGAEEKTQATFDVFSQWVDDKKQDASRFFDHIFTQDEDVIKKAQTHILDRSKEDAAKLQEMLTSAASNIAGLFGEKVGGTDTGGSHQFSQTKDTNKPSSAAQDDDSLLLSGHDLLAGVMQLVSSVASGAADKEESAMQLVERAKEIADGNSAYETRTFRQMYDVFAGAFQLVSQSIDAHFGDIKLSQFNPFSFLYYLELEDMRKNASWKRRAHRFFRSLRPEEVIELHESLFLAELAYVDTIDEIRSGLEDGSDWELIHAQLTSSPAEPGHFVAVRRNQKKKSDDLEVLLSVRGTKEIGDLLSDAFLDAEPYRGGKAHAGVKMSGQYLVNKHTKLLMQMLELSGKKKIKLMIVGHSLGAGAGSIAAFEFNDNPNIEASAIGFGCPALLTKDLSDVDFIQTVVSDADVVPRMSGASVRNAVLDIMAYDWADVAYRDVEFLIQMIRKTFKALPISDEFEKSVLAFVKKTLDESIKPFCLRMNKDFGERLEPILIPPGKCIHFYRDGSGFSGRHTPCSFFDSVEISRTMIDDHLTPQGYHRSMLLFMRDVTDDIHFRFAHDALF